MITGSLFSGILGPELAAEAAGVETAWCAEVDPFCNKVIKYRRPDLPNLGDVREINGRRIQAVDVVTAGFPCQDLSVAGRRAGLAGERSSLFWEIIRIIGDMREASDGANPSFLILENVPGLFSSNGGRDFATVLAALAQLGALDIGWRVLDSQYFGVPQQRRRIYLVADFRGRRAAEVLFEPGRCEGHPSPGGAEGQGVAGALASRARGAGGKLSGGSEDDYNLTLAALEAGDRDGIAAGPDDEIAKPLGSNATGGFRFDLDHDTYVTPSMTAKWAKGTGGPSGDGVQNLVSQPAVYTIQERAVSENLQNGPGGKGWRDDGSAYTLEARSRGQAVVFESRFARNGRGGPREIVPTLKAESGQTGKGDAAPLVITHALTAEGADASEDGTSRGTPLAPSKGTIRRLTPVECELLQNFPPGWTCLCGAEGDIWACRCADGPRYRALGNAWTTGPESPAAFIFSRMEALL